MISIVILSIVFLLIAVRRIGRLRLQIWQVMLFGAAAVLLSGQIPVGEALRSINLDVMLFLFGMFVVGQALQASGYLAHLSHRMFRRARSLDQLVLLVLLVMGLGAALLMNDTLAIIGTPAVLVLAKRQGVSPKLLLLSLAFAVTIGSVPSPIGNPQNLLIALNGHVPNPFVTFLKYLLVPTAINLAVAYGLLRLFYRKQFGRELSAPAEEPLLDPKLASISRVSLILVVVLALGKVASVLLRLPFDFKLTYIALVAAAPILLGSKRRFEVLKGVDWATLVFFASMFVLMQSVWRSGVLQGLITGVGAKITSIEMILGVSVAVSQLISNVPLVALYLPMLTQTGATAKEMAALAAGSTIAGNLFILGAASNVIIIQNAEQKDGQTLTFLEFAAVGVPLTALNVLVYWLFFALL
jgi:Na+/H+ antiporter NhaD/arsenite permease-like protein